MTTIKKRLDEIRTELRNETISYSEIMELHSLVKHLKCLFLIS